MKNGCMDCCVRATKCRPLLRTKSFCRAGNQRSLVDDIHQSDVQGLHVDCKACANQTVASTRAKVAIVASLAALSR